MNLNLFNVNSQRLNWYKKMLTVSFLSLAIGLTIIVTTFILASSGILNWPSPYFGALITISIGSAVLTGAWAGLAHTRRQMHSVIPTFTFMFMLMIFPILNYLLTLIYLGLTLIIFGLSIMYTVSCNGDLSGNDLPGDVHK